MINYKNRSYNICLTIFWFVKCQNPAISVHTFDKENGLCQLGSITAVLPTSTLSGFPSGDIVSVVVDSNAIPPKGNYILAFLVF